MFCPPEYRAAHVLTSALYFWIQSCTCSSWCSVHLNTELHMFWPVLCTSEYKAAHVLTSALYFWIQSFTCSDQCSVLLQQFCTVCITRSPQQMWIVCTMSYLWIFTRYFCSYVNREICMEIVHYYLISIWRRPAFYPIKSKIKKFFFFFHLGEEFLGKHEGEKLCNVR